jgi:ABC-type lipoprotein release transport system permease subunit
VLGIPLLNGRGFTALGGGEVAIVNQAFADSYWPHQDPIGKYIVNPATAKAIRIVGVVRTGKYQSVAEAATPTVYRPINQEYVSTVILHVRTALRPETLLPAITREVESYDATIPVFGAKTMRQELAISVAPYEAITTLLSIFGGFALVLAFAGLYSLVAYQVRSRTREIGIRMALGALPSRMLQMLAAQGMKLLVIGICMAIPIATAISFLISRFLFGSSALDPWTFVGVPSLLVVVALVAILLPARQAIKIEPAQALRAL